MKFKERTLLQLADMICGNARNPEEPTFFKYRSSSHLTEFFRDADTEYAHDGSTRRYWVAERLRLILEEPHKDAATPPEPFLRVVKLLMDPEDASDEGSERLKALGALNAAISREGFEAFYATDKQCYLRHVASNTVAQPQINPHRPFTAAELDKRARLTKFLESASEDELIEEVLLPLFRQLGFHRITAAGHRDKALEYGKDLWMKFTLPTTHVLYFGIQVKKGRLDSAGLSKPNTANVAEIHNQVNMMLGHEIFDSEIGKRVLVDHAFIVAGGEITKQARNWLGNKLDASKRSQVMFIDREDILNLYVVTSLPLPTAALPQAPVDADNDSPF